MSVTTHVLDLMGGHPAAGMAVALEVRDGRLYAARRRRDWLRRPAGGSAAGPAAPGGRRAPAAVRHRRLVRGAPCRGLLPGGERGVRRQRPDPALPRAAAAEPVRLLDLPGELR